jgi:hypothetical protein
VDVKGNPSKEWGLKNSHLLLGTQDGSVTVDCQSHTTELNSYCGLGHPNFVDRKLPGEYPNKLLPAANTVKMTDRKGIKRYKLGGSSSHRR